MPNRKNLYRDMDKFRVTFRNQKRRYRLRTGSGKFKPRRWTKEEDKLVLAHQIFDRDLAKKLSRSVSSVQGRRVKLKKKLKEKKQAKNKKAKKLKAGRVKKK